MKTAEILSQGHVCIFVLPLSFNRGLERKGDTKHRQQTALYRKGISQRRGISGAGVGGVEKDLKAS